MVEGASFWDSEVVVRNHTEWMGHPLVREHMNELLGGETPRWPFDMFQDWLQGRTFQRGLSIGCGAGALERDIIRRDLCRHVDAFDGSVVSLSIAADEARKQGFGDRISYYAADFNRPALPRRKYDIVFFHQSAHHVSELELLYAEILRAIKPNGLIYLDEFVGPSRDWWHDALLARQRAVYQAIPPEKRIYDELPFPIQMDDPSEAVRSSEIEAYLGVGFKTLLRRDYGGSLLSVIIPALRPEAVDEAMVRWLIDEERKMLQAGEKSYYAVIVAKPKSLLRRLKARFTYPRLLKERHEREERQRQAALAAHSPAR
jgi:SAM-dependent methyltransferase